MMISYQLEYLKIAFMKMISNEPFVIVGHETMVCTVCFSMFLSKRIAPETRPNKSMQSERLFN